MIFLVFGILVAGFWRLFILTLRLYLVAKKLLFYVFLVEGKGVQI